MKLKFKIYTFLVFVIMILSYLVKDRILFEYYVWHLSDESYQVREEFAEKIIKLDTQVLPMLVKKLDKRYIYETEYIIYCLERITHHRGNYKETLESVKYWKLWAIKNQIK